MTKFLLIALTMASITLSINLQAESQKDFSKEENRYFAIEMAKCMGA